MSRNNVPPYCRQRRKGRPDLAYLTLQGERFYLGDYGTPQSHTEYNRLIAEWIAGGEQAPVQGDSFTVVELLARYLKFAKGYYRDHNGDESSEVENLTLAIRPLKELYAHSEAKDFGPKAYKACRQWFIEKDNCRTYINRHMERVKRIFKWAVAEELIFPSVYQALQAVSGLKRGRTQARESKKVVPAKGVHINAIQSHVSRQVWAMVQLQLLTAARSGEIVGMRAIDLDMSGKIWVYKPKNHKTAYRDHERYIYLGPRGQEVVKPFLVNRSLDSYLFSPKEAEEERRRKLHEQRITPLSCGNKPGSNKKKNPGRVLSDQYTVASYRRAITRGCEHAGVPKWHPHQLRHNAATYLRKEFGLEVARIILGHKTAAITEVYAELDQGKAIEVMGEIG